MAPPNPAHSTEVSLQPGELIITKTDPKGLITYANRVFMRISGYAEHQLLGQPHNIIRHPDMPRGVYRMMWKTLQAGEEFFGVVKNYTIDGNYYWVLANITPDYDRKGQLQGYYSVRRRPSREAVEAASRLYAEMRAIEARTSKPAAPDASAAWLTEEVARTGQDYTSYILSLNAGALGRGERA
ncbi:PAS domain-containing protein [Gulbenkiania mobilis]|uniref:PAS domain-containing protein n=1 Tax=Gulbenkiania mobilis TaxID=397457 RepID=UPI0006BC0642|nr:PAS domain-containing protein [Gulbenkiania mobilis]